MRKYYKPIWPVAAMYKMKERDKFGAYRHGGRSHAGIDIYNDGGTSVIASLEGIVVRANGPKGHEKYGGLVVLDHIADMTSGQDTDVNCAVYTVYAHLESVFVSAGQRVMGGTTIGTVGNTGNAKGMQPHLHFETIITPKRLGWNQYGNTGVKAGIDRVDPMKFLAGFSLSEGCHIP